jgi:hypothetical protein
LPKVFTPRRGSAALVAGGAGGALLAGLALALDLGWTGGFLAYGCGATAIAVMLPAPAPRPARRLA